MVTARTFLVRGLLAGLVAGVLAFGVAYLVGEPPVAAAISLEEPGAAVGVDHHAMDDAAAAGHSHGDDAEAVVSRESQSTWGLLTATVLFGTALGGIIAVAAAFAAGRLGPISARASTAIVTAIGFLAVYLVPYLKYPPNPPAVGNPDTIGPRTAWYFALLAVSVAAAVLAIVVARRLTPRLGAWNSCLVAAGGYLVVLLAAGWLLPIVDEVPAGFPADLLWRFRVASLAIQATLWAAIGLALATMIGVVVRQESERAGGSARLAGTAA
jgi:predicted cobalt transporter CbtA